MKSELPEKQNASNPKESGEQPGLETEWRRYEEFIEEISKRLRPGPAKPGWQKLLESGGGVALITVLLGGLLGQLISMYIQNSLRNRDYEQTISKAQYDRDLADYSKFLDQGSDTVKQIYPLVGRCISASEDLIWITKPQSNQEGLSRKEAQIERAQRDEKKIKFNETDNKWREAQEGLGYLMRYYHHNDDGVTRSWRTVQQSTTDYMQCARDTLGAYAPDNLTPKDAYPCLVKKDAVLRALDALAQSVESNRKVIGVSKQP